MPAKSFMSIKDLLDLIYNPFKFRNLMKGFKIKDFKQARAFCFEDLCRHIVDSMPRYEMNFQNKKYLITSETALYLTRHYLTAMNPDVVITTDIKEKNA